MKHPYHVREMNKNSMNTITCAHCGLKKEITDCNSNAKTKETGFEVVYDISNGLTMIYLCQHCSDAIRKRVRIIEDILNKPISHVNLMNFSSKRDN